MTASYTVVFSKIAQQEFDKIILSDRRIGEQIAKAIDRLAANPSRGNFLKGEWTGYRKYRTGDCRIVYRVEHAKLIVYIIAIDDRKDVYR